MPAKRGRPSKYGSKGESAVRSIRTNPKSWNKWSNIASRHGLTMGDLVNFTMTHVDVREMAKMAQTQSEEK